MEHDQRHTSWHYSNVNAALLQLPLREVIADETPGRRFWRSDWDCCNKVDNWDIQYPFVPFLLIFGIQSPFGEDLSSIASRRCCTIDLGGGGQIKEGFRCEGGLEVGQNMKRE